MNELQVVVNQQPGSASWNFDELKTALQNEMQRYEGVIYDSTSIKAAKGDVADLRKLRKMVEDCRKEIKERCMEPYTVIEAQAKELTALIDRPINMISKQVQEYELEQKQKRKEAILSYMDEVFADLTGDIARQLQFKTYDSRWENAATTKKSWKEAIDAAHSTALSEIQILDGVESDFRETAFDVYTKNLSLADALNKVCELRQQKESILENERRRREAEATRQYAQELHGAEVAVDQKKAEKQIPASVEVVAHEEKPSITPAPIVTIAEEISKNQEHHHIIRFIGSENQYRKAIAYIKYIGADYAEV